MQCTIEQGTLLNTLLEAVRFTGNKALTPLLAGIHFACISDNQLEIRASSGQVVYKALLPCKVESPGSCIAPASYLLSVVKSLDAGELVLRQEEEKLFIEQKKSSFELSLLTGSDFPDVAKKENRRKLLFPLEHFMAASKQVMIAASADETKPVLTSVYLEMRHPNALVATDGFRLYQVGVDLSLDEEGKALLPARILRDLLGVVEKRELGVLEGWLSPEGTEIVFQFGELEVQVSLVTGDFPPYKAIIPQACSFSFVVGKEELSQALKQAMIFAKELSSIVVFQVDTGELIVRSQSSAQGKSRSTLPIRALDGEPVKFACNGRYVQDFLATLAEDEVMIRGTESLKPVLFSAPTDEHRFYLIMPFKLPDESSV